MTSAAPLPPPVLTLAGALAQRLLPRGPSPGPVRRAAAQTLAVASGVVMFGASARFLAAGTTVDPRAPERAAALVTAGPNRISRNPMYLGMIGLLAAHAVVRDRWAAWLPVAAVAVALDRMQVPLEERALRERFGAEYEAYCAAVPRWLGRPGGSPAAGGAPEAGAAPGSRP
ncbi:isoprenylcysteine carboxylmethyltransferase family protein [Citricoccus sp. SGAir0253]|uniref:methyltransferase family protein n=1 Tax=Citricoccus sp. SGAir0253 TaxID=2567881 RepID=UPI0010CCD15E|nr:isoprenylcysteine carboxylmethyltransferase family protein [Citricoccus sp. SGAir0253]QCU77635.1 isoprenylcysteine carboxylmethyltransferase family protein [Citricoccus sp. SGAir0253]